MYLCTYILIDLHTYIQIYIYIYTEHHYVWIYRVLYGFCSTWDAHPSSQSAKLGVFCKHANKNDDMM